ncbi:MAG TPA: MFS transporter [Streptosporangiaceae bacterium]|nr:MFS transporter [Streptosporangiaceae bacterium]
MSSTPPVPAAAAPAAAAPKAAADSRRAAAVVGVLALAVFMSSLDLFIVNLAFPYIAKQYPGTSLSSLSWVLNAYTIVFAAVLVPAGRWADRIGRRRVFTAGLACFSVGSVLCALAPGVNLLIAARVVQAAGAGAMVPASLSLLLAAVPAAARAKALGTWSALGALGAALGPVIGGSLVQVNWRWVFWINVPVGIAAVLLAVRVVPESRDAASRGRPDLVGAGLLAAAVGLLAFALVEAPGWGWGSAGFTGLLAASVACGVLMVMRSRRHHSPVIELELLRSRTFSGAFAASILYYAAFGAFVLSAVEFLTGVWRYSAVEAGLAIAPGPLMVLPFARVVAPRLAARLGGPGRVAVIGCLVNAGAQLLWLSQIQATPDYVTHLLPAQLLGGAGVGLTIPSLLGAGSASLTPGRFGTGSGILNTARQVGTVLGVAGLVAILSRVAPADPVAAYRNGIVLIIAFFAAAAAVSAVLLTGRATGRAADRPAGRPVPAQGSADAEPAAPGGALLGRGLTGPARR